MSPAMSVPAIARLKTENRPIVVVTAYDYTFARLLDQSGVDIILVGDSLGMVVQGHETTLPVTLDEMIYHAAAVSRGTRQAMVVCDLPFGICQSSKELVMAASIRVLKESASDAVKIEGGVAVAETIGFLTRQGIPVMAHIGLTPQSVKAFGGFKVQGRDDAGASQLLADALAVEQAGAFAVVLEGIPSNLATRITQQLSIPTIGIGAGLGCDGQVLVLYDLLGLYEDVKPRFVKQYMAGGASIRAAVERYAQEVRGGQFPGPEHGFSD
ncbi:MAG: 3-methyl-2-oxobutanoate hydroxymethyltransferase [Magnetococcales bacterium]|nr:3-methyl-2-oxobutanoate hydroxymethyltransferase [Magnetococcales bacterium]